MFFFPFWYFVRNNLSSFVCVFLICWKLEVYQSIFGSLPFYNCTIVNCFSSMAILVCNNLSNESVSSKQLNLKNQSSFIVYLFIDNKIWNVFENALWSVSDVYSETCTYQQLHIQQHSLYNDMFLKSFDYTSGNQSFLGRI